MILLLALILPVFIFFLFKNQKNAAKSHIPPSPPGLPVVGNLHQFDTFNSHVYLFKLAKKYGPLMSMKLGKVQVLIVSSAKMAKEVLKTHDVSFCSRPTSLGMQKLTYGGLDIGFSPYNDSWRELRKICVLHLLSSKQVQSFRTIREDEVFRMIKTIANSSSSGVENGVNLSTIVLELTRTLICRIAFGMKSGEDESNKRRFDDLLLQAEAMQGGFFVSDYLPLFSWVDKLSGMLSRLDKAFRDMDEFNQGLIDEHLDSNYKDKDIFIAGSGTTATAIVWAMTALMKTPNTMKKLQTEIRETTGEKDFVDEDDVPQLPYLKAVVKETLRLYPPGPLLIPRETLKECVIEGYTILPKSLVYVNAWAIARDPKYWRDPEEFMPERFLNTSVDIIGQDFEVIPFGAGRRVCPGMSIGLATMELTLANLVYCFDWELPEGSAKEDIDTEALSGLTMHKKSPLCLVPRKYGCAWIRGCSTLTSCVP